MPILYLVVALAAQLPQSDCLSKSPPEAPPPDRLAALRTMEDVASVAVLANGTPAPGNVVLPVLNNRRQTLQYMLANYPDAKHVKNAAKTGIAWVCVDRKGRVARASLVTGTGNEKLDSLSIGAIGVAEFDPARVGADTVEIWVPLPAQVPSKDDLITVLSQNDLDHSNAPVRTPFTQAPELLNRSRVEDAIVRIVYNVNAAARQRDDRFNRAQQAGGKTILWIYIDVEGNVTNSIVKKTSGNADLDANARQIASMMRFAPAKNNGKPVDVWIEVPINFSAR